MTDTRHTPYRWVEDDFYGSKELVDNEGNTMLSAEIEYSLEPNEGVDYLGIHITEGFDDFLLRAVNSHAELVEIAREYLDRFSVSDDKYLTAEDIAKRDRIEQALKKASE